MQGTPDPLTGLPHHFHRVLLLVGQLNYTWTNTESLLIHLIAGLARVDKETAIVIFLTLNTSKARIELVERLAKMPRTEANCRRDILAATGRLVRQGKLRNKYSHAIYAFDEAGSSATTQLMRITESRDTIRYGKIEDLGPAELEAISKAIAEIRDTNREFWRIVETYRFPR